MFLITLCSPCLCSRFRPEVGSGLVFFLSHDAVETHATGAAERTAAKCEKRRLSMAQDAQRNPTRMPRIIRSDPDDSSSEQRDCRRIFGLRLVDGKDLGAQYYRRAIRL